MRAAIIACTVGGMPVGAESGSPRAASGPTLRGRAGFPSVCRRARVSALRVERLPGRPRASSSVLTVVSRRARAARSCSRERCLHPSRGGVEQVGRARRQRITTVSHAARRDARPGRASRRRPSAGPRTRARAACTEASSAAHVRAAHAISVAARSSPTASSTPEASPSRSATASSPQQARSFSLRVHGVVVRDPGRGLHHLGRAASR